MNPLLARLIETDFRDLEGLTVNGSIPLRDALLNEALRAFLTAPPQPGGGGLDVREFLRFVRSAQVRTTEGALVIDFSIAV